MDNQLKVAKEKIYKLTYLVFCLLVFLCGCHITVLLIWEQEFVSDIETCCSWGTACVCWLLAGWLGRPWLPVFVWWENWQALPSSPPSHLWEGGLCLLKRPSLDARVFLPAAQRGKSQGLNLARWAKNSSRFLTCPCFPPVREEVKFWSTHNLSMVCPSLCLFR